MEVRKELQLIVAMSERADGPTLAGPMAPREIRAESGLEVRRQLLGIVREDAHLSSRTLATKKGRA
jgi:hypothetical protein